MTETDLQGKLRDAFQRKRYGDGADYDPDNDLFEVAADEIGRLRQCLGQACRQWRMYADLQEDRDLATEESVEGVLYRKCIEAQRRDGET